MRLTTLILRPSELCFNSTFVLLANFFLRYQVHYDESFDKTLVVDGVPVIDRSRLERLLTKLTKEFSRKGVSIKQDDIFMPWDNASGKSKG